jgi:hypothetical protein
MNKHHCHKREEEEEGVDMEKMGKVFSKQNISISSETSSNCSRCSEEGEVEKNDKMIEYPPEDLLNYQNDHQQSDGITEEKERICIFEISKLSLDILKHIFYTFLTPNEIIMISCTCKNYFYRTNTNSFWLELCKRDFNLDEVPPVLKQALLSKEMTEESSPISASQLSELLHYDEYPENFPLTKVIYCFLASKWTFETPRHPDLVVSDNGFTVERTQSVSRNPACLCTEPFQIYEQQSKARTFGRKSYFEIRVEQIGYWISIGAAENSLSRYGDFVLGNTRGVTAIGYYGATYSPTFNLNHEILTGCNVRALARGDIVGVHIYSVKDHSCLITDNLTVANYRRNYMEEKGDKIKEWNVFAAIYLNGEMLCELPIMKNKDSCKLYPAVCLGHTSKVKILLSYCPTQQ